jgi:hypothetical protein
MHNHEVQIRMVEGVSDVEAQQIVDIAKQWPAQFVPEAIKAIRNDARRFPCYLATREQVVVAFLVVVPAGLELELLWSAAHVSCFRRAHYIRLLIEAAEKDFFTNSPSCLLSFAKMSAPDAVIPGNETFQGDASRNMRRLVAKLGYRQEYCLASYWQPKNDCVLVVKRKSSSI